MNWRSTDVQNSHLSPSGVRGERGTLKFSWVSTHLNFFWTSLTLYSSDLSTYISRTCWASVRAGYPQRLWTKSDLHGRQMTTPRPLRTSPGVFSSPQGRTRVAVVTFQSIFVRLFFAWTISWDEAQTAIRFEIITLLFPSAGRAGTSFTSCFRPFDFLLTYANLNLKKTSKTSFNNDQLP